MKKVFLGGTTAKSTWRGDLISKLKIDYFNPVVSDWNEEARKRELRERDTADFLLYVITPDMEGVYSIAEVIDDSHKNPKKTVFCVLSKSGKKSFSDAQKTSLKAVSDMVERNGGTVCKNLSDVATFLNGEKAMEKKAAQQHNPEDLQKAMDLLMLTVLVAEGKAPNIPGLEMIEKNLDKRGQALKMRSKKFMANIGKLRGLIKEITEAADAESKKPDEVGENAVQASEIETPETANIEVPQVREVSASDKTAGVGEGDKESVSIYKDRERAPEKGVPANIHDEIFGTLNKEANNIDFGIGSPAVTDEDKDNLGKLY